MAPAVLPSVEDCMKSHGISDRTTLSDSDSGKSELDECYYNNRLPSIETDYSRTVTIEAQPDVNTQLETESALIPEDNGSTHQEKPLSSENSSMIAPTKYIIHHSDDARAKVEPSHFRKPQVYHREPIPPRLIVPPKQKTTQVAHPEVGHSGSNVTTEIATASEKVARELWFMADPALYTKSAATIYEPNLRSNGIHGGNSFQPDRNVLLAHQMHRGFSNQVELPRHQIHTGFSNQTQLPGHQMPLGFSNQAQLLGHQMPRGFSNQMVLPGHQMHRSLSNQAERLQMHWGFNNQTELPVHQMHRGISNQAEPVHQMHRGFGNQAELAGHQMHRDLSNQTVLPVHQMHRGFGNPAELAGHQMLRDLTNQTVLPRDQTHRVLNNQTKLMANQIVSVSGLTEIIEHQLYRDHSDQTDLPRDQMDKGFNNQTELSEPTNLSVRVNIFESPDYSGAHPASFSPEQSNESTLPPVDSASFGEVPLPQNYSEDVTAGDDEYEAGFCQKVLNCLCFLC